MSQTEHEQEQHEEVEEVSAPGEPEPDEEHAEPDEHEPIEGPDDENDGAENDDAAEITSEYEPGVAEAGLLSERDLEKRLGQLDKENARHYKRLGEILEEDALHIVPCPVCADGFCGWVFDPKHAPLSDEQRNNALQLLGLSDFEDIPQASWAVTCETCNGHGRVKTGSKKDGREVTDCADCGGAGWHNLHARKATNGHVEHELTELTGPTVFGTDEPDPRVLSLREEGWMVVPPTILPTAA